MNRNQVNQVIQLSPERLDRTLATIHARQLHSFVALVVNIPTDVTSVVLRLFKTDRVSHYDIPVNRRPNGTGLAYAIGTCFPDVGASFYEIHAYDARGNMTALGEGEVLIDRFSASGEPLTPGVSRPVMQIADATGALHTIVAVFDGDNWTSVLDAQ